MALMKPRASPSNRGRQQVLIPFVAVMLGLSGMSAWPGGPRTSWGATAQGRDSCADPQTQAAINACAGQEYKEADAALNTVYRQLMEKVEAKQKAQLKAAQVAWVKFRDAHCAFATALYEGGSMAPTISYGCLTAMTKSRTEELKRVLENLLTQ
jgi:uncharacterized protein YecT (DUF1311 family)